MGLVDNKKAAKNEWRNRRDCGWPKDAPSAPTIIPRPTKSLAQLKSPGLRYGTSAYFCFFFRIRFSSSMSSEDIFCFSTKCTRSGLTDPPKILSRKDLLSVCTHSASV